MRLESRTRRTALVAMLSALAAASGAPARAQTAEAAVATPSAEALMQENWRETIARTSVPHEGCFQA